MFIHWSVSISSAKYMAGGLTSGITGNRANLILIDDPVKGREAADSPTIRKKTLEAYEDDIKTRILPDASIIIVQTRWHENDLAGSILPEGYNGEMSLTVVDLTEDGTSHDYALFDKYYNDFFGSSGSSVKAMSPTMLITK